MNHLPYQVTPISLFCSKSANYKLGGVKFKRDDLFLKAGGGSKARMLQYILADTSPENCDVLVTAGGPCSNFNRACALQCASMGIRMHLIAYTEYSEEFKKSENFFLCELTGVKVTICSKSNVAQTIATVMEEYKAKGIKAKNIYGGGRSLHGIFAYYDAVKELYEQTCGDMPRHIYVACGTGTTTAGLLAGLQEYSPKTRLHAISVARQRNDELPVIQEDIQWLNSYLNKNYNLSNLCFHDEFIMGEYGASTPELVKFIKEFISSSGILVDPIYSGKALYGMANLMSDNQAFDSLFWHTGAIYTLLSNKNAFL